MDKLTLPLAQTASSKVLPLRTSDLPVLLELLTSKYEQRVRITEQQEGSTGGCSYVRLEFDQTEDVWTLALDWMQHVYYQIAEQAGQDLAAMERLTHTVVLTQVEQGLPQRDCQCLVRWCHTVDGKETAATAILAYSVFDGFDNANGRITHWAELIASDDAVVMIQEGGSNG